MTKEAPTPEQQAGLRANGQLAEPSHIWLSPCGSFALEPRKPEAPKRRRVRLGAAAR
jgi:hypothetical protein